MKKSTRPRTAAAAAAVAVVLTGIGVTAANATSAQQDQPVQYTFEAYRQTIAPFHVAQIPSLTCPVGYLINERLSEGRSVPKGVQVLEPGGVGVVISDVTSEKVDVGGQTRHLVTGTDAERSYSEATNWDPFSSHELVINLACTTDLGDAATDPAYDRD